MYCTQHTLPTLCSLLRTPQQNPCHSRHLPCSIPVAVLSVCSTQYKTVLDALRSRKERFLFEDVEISLKPTVMAFITMNPGYPGRAGGL